MKLGKLKHDARKQKGKTRQYNFKVQNCRPVHDKDYITEKEQEARYFPDEEEGEDCVVVAEGTAMKEEAV